VLDRFHSGIFANGRGNIKIALLQSETAQKGVGWFGCINSGLGASTVFCSRDKITRYQYLHVNVLMHFATPSALLSLIGKKSTNLVK
jgi:hypothetical protein